MCLGFAWNSLQSQNLSPDTYSKALRVSFTWQRCCLSFSCVSGQRASYGKNSAKINEFEGMGQHTFIPKEAIVLVTENWHLVKIMSSPAIKEFGLKKKNCSKVILNLAEKINSSFWFHTVPATTGEGMFPLFVWMSPQDGQTAAECGDSLNGVTHGRFQELLHLAVASSACQGSASCHRPGQFAKTKPSGFPPQLSRVDYLVERSQQISAASPTLAPLYQWEIPGMK